MVGVKVEETAGEEELEVVDLLEAVIEIEIDVEEVEVEAEEFKDSKTKKILYFYYILTL